MGLSGVGGRRPGAGRPKGVPNKTTRTRTEEIQRSGADPLEVMIEAMRAYQAAAGRAGKAQRLVLLEKAAGIAKDAAPYVHQRLSAISIPTTPLDPAKLSDAQLAQLKDLILAATVARGDQGGAVSQVN